MSVNALPTGRYRGRARRLAGLALTATLIGSGALGIATRPVAHAEGGASFTSLAAGYTQELFGTSSSFLGGLAFAGDGDVWATTCQFSGSPLLRWDLQSTTTVQTTSIHASLASAPSDAGCGLTNHPNGSLYSNTSRGVSRLNADTGAVVAAGFGPAGNALGIAVDPITDRLVYVGSNGAIEWVAPDFSSSGRFSAVTVGRFVDGIYFDPSGDFLFLADRSPVRRLTILDRSGLLVQSVAMTSEPDGIAFHSVGEQFVVTSNLDGTMTRFDFPNGDYTRAPAKSVFASGGFRGDLSQVGPDGCLYLTQDDTRYNNGVVSSLSSVVRVCPGFSPPPGTGDPCAGVDLVICYAPDVRFHPDEQFFPMDPQDYIAESELKFAQYGTLCFSDTSLTDDLTVLDIAQQNYTARKVSYGLISHGPWLPTAGCRADGDRYGLLDFTRPFDEDSTSERSRRPDGLSTENGFFLKYTGGDTIEGNLPNANRRVVAPIFAQITADELGVGASVITYQMFYGRDPKAAASIADQGLAADLLARADGILAHQGDWERVDVVLSATNDPVEVRYFAHGCEGTTFESKNFVSWGDLEAGVPTGGGLTAGTHPIVYSAQGSHGSYPNVHGAGNALCPDAGELTDGLKGFTDETAFDVNVSGLWQTWLTPGLIVDPVDECWHGFGGAWGETAGELATFVSGRVNILADATGPAGPYHNLRLGTPAPFPAACLDGSPRIRFVGPVLYEWEQPGSVTIDQAAVGNEYVLTLASVESILGSASVGAAGSAMIDYVIPAGTAPGSHRLIVRDGASGRIVGVELIGVTAPGVCITDDPALDRDGDLVINECDSSDFDGPIADADRDGIVNAEDNCAQQSNPDQARLYDRSAGSACDTKQGYNPLEVLRNPCAGMIADVVGTDGDDVIVGTAAGEVIVGLGGNDVIDGAGGDDVICETAGANTIRGGNGRDRIYGGVGPDTIDGGNEGDLIRGGASDDIVNGGNGADVVFGDDGDDRLGGDSGDDNGNDRLYGGAGDDFMSGGNGDDTLDGGTGFDTGDGGRSGVDTCRLIDVATNCEM